MGISVSMITNNEEKKLDRTLESVYKWVDEIIIVDSHSTDRTVEIAKKYGAKVFIEDWKGFGPQKNSALEKCTEDWILMIDADEEVTPELAEEIQREVNNPRGKVYEILRQAWCFNKKTNHKDYAIRLVKKGVGKYDSKKVHETFRTDKKAEKIKKIINHHTYISHEEYFDKFNKYTTLSAQEMHKKGRKVSFFKLILNPIYKFIKKYFFKKGFRDGEIGFIMSIYSAYYNFVKYAKLKDLNDE
ncbi:MAG: glycosyltransferase family 2 protein [Fusobacteriota bacterium]